MKKVYIYVLCGLFFGFLLLIKTPTVYAVQFDLIQPSGTFKQGDTVKFTININTQGESVKDTEIGVSFQSQDLQYVSTEAGNTLSTITGENRGGVGIIVKGTDAAGFSGTGVYAYVNFKIIATQPGSTQLCSLFTPPTQPTAPLIPTATTRPPTPSVLPRTGGADAILPVTLIGLLSIAIPSLLLSKKNF
jgi:hypothetical protein